MIVTHPKGQCIKIRSVFCDFKNLIKEARIVMERKGMKCWLKCYTTNATKIIRDGNEFCESCYIAWLKYFRLDYFSNKSSSVPPRSLHKYEIWHEKLNSVYIYRWTSRKYTLSQGICKMVRHRSNIVSNHRELDRLSNSLTILTAKKTRKLCLTCHLWGIPCHTRSVCKAERVPMSRHHYGEGPMLTYCLHEKPSVSKGGCHNFSMRSELIL